MSFDKTELSNIKDNAIVVMKADQLPLISNTYPIGKNKGGYNSGIKFSFIYSKLDSISKSLFNNYLAGNHQLSSYNSSKYQQSQHESAFRAINFYTALIANKYKYSAMQLLKANTAFKVLLFLINQTSSKNKIITEVAISNST